jgi:eukaryotic-like serine/threonine-protein kinase
MKEKFKNSFLFNLGVVTVLCALLYVLFFASLRFVTRHGEEMLMPDVRGKSMDSVVSMLNSMEFETLIDSTYEPTMRPLSILKQVPDTGSYVKRGRTIFLTVNMLTPPRIPMPNIKDLSYRSAEMVLRNNKLIVGDTTYKPDIATGAILEASFKGKVLTAGDLVLQGSKIDLLIGNGLGNTEWDVPNVTDMTVEEAMIYLNQFNLQPILVSGDPLSPITDTPSSIITDQRPRAFKANGEHNRTKMGDFIDLHIMQHPAPEDIYNTNRSSDVNNGSNKKRK